MIGKLPLESFFEKRPSAYFAETATDKLNHRYGEFYDMVIGSLLMYTHTLNVLELGVSRFGAGSGHAFAAMPYVEKFVGIDESSLSTPLPPKGVFIQGDAYAMRTFEKARAQGAYNLIIDDCVHETEYQAHAFSRYRQLACIPYCYVIEDIRRGRLVMLLDTIKDPSMQVTITEPMQIVSNTDSVLLYKLEL